MGKTSWHVGLVVSMRGTDEDFSLSSCRFQVGDTLPFFSTFSQIGLIGSPPYSGNTLRRWLLKKERFMGVNILLVA